jgi:hypothetical protein
LNKAGWAQFRKLVAGVSEEELSAFLCEYAPLLRPANISEEEFAVILRGHADFLRKGRPEEPPIHLKTSDRAPILGALAATDDEWASIRAELALEPPRDPVAEAEQFEKLLEAIESGAIRRERPGRIRGKQFARAGDPALADECLTKADGNTTVAMAEFIEQIAASMSEQARRNGTADETARKRWYLATEPDGTTTRRVKRK